MASTSKGKGAVKTKSWNKHLRPFGKRQAAKDVRKDGKKQIKDSEEDKPITESAHIAKFINAISARNYAQANKYLKAVVEKKLQNRINKSLNKPLF